jgi:hypothetical protein
MKRGRQEVAVACKLGFSNWLASDAYWSIFCSSASPPAVPGQGNLENTFETPDFDAIVGSLKKPGARFAHQLRELPWAKRGFGFYDPVCYIIDISETHGALMRRLAAEGMPKDRIAAHVTLIQEQIDKYLSGGTDRCRARG